MKYFIIYNNQGKILRTGNCFDADLQYQNGVDEYVLEGQADYNTQYIKDGAVVDMPIKPNEGYYFDYTTYEWVFDTEKAISEATTKRDILLKNGPDRISPIWWSAMTQEEQQAWTDYRQSLLDITAQPNYPQEIIWPTKP